MKPIVFTKHALKRISQRGNIEKYYENMFRKAQLIHQTKDRLFYRNGRFRFVAREQEGELRILTVMKDQ